MEVLYERCAGMDVHKAKVAVCVWITESGGKATTHHRSFGTTTPEILELADWMHQFGVKHLAMESIGVYWRPIYELLEGQFTILVVNAQHVHNLPGRKTDVGDAQWLGDLLRHGLLKPSFVPPRPQRELRELVRHRVNLVQRRSQVVNELQQVLELADIKLSSVVSDITGVSATEMLEKLLAGQTDPELLAELARGRLRKKKELLTKALEGQVRDHHRLILAQQLAEIGSLEEDIQTVSNEIGRRTAEHQELISRLDEIPGINRRIAEIILAEMGPNPEVFGNNPKRAMAWAEVCPGNDESGGKRRVSRVRSGNRKLTTAAVEAALAASKSKRTYFSALYRRIAFRRGHKKAVLAVAHSILLTAFCMIMRGTRYTDLGPDYFDRLRPQRAVSRLTRRLRQMGFAVEIKPIAVPG